MRKILFCIVLLIGGACLCGAVTADAANSAKNVSVLECGGRCEAMEQGFNTWVSVTPGMKLGPGDKIRTGEKSYIDLDFGGPSQAAVVRVGQRSSMKIDTYIASEKIEERKIDLDLAIGDIFVKANKIKNESQFQVHTPTSVVGVRGTAFEVRVSSEK